MQKILLPDEDAEIGPVPTSAGGHRPEPEPELDRLSNILRTFNEHFGDIRWQDADRVTQLITETIPARVAADTAFRNASFKRWLTDTVFALAYEPATTPHTAG